MASRARFQSLLRRWREARESLVPSPSEVCTTNMLGGAWARQQGGSAWHVNKAALQKLGQEELVHGLLEIGQVGQLCEACQAGKQ
jgi:hypothetical protein